jgi:hypothetical protein
MTESESNESATTGGSSQNGEHDGHEAEQVTREQGGQYIEESSGLERVVVPHQRPSGDLESRDLESVRARNVTMTQSGAENIDAETVTMNSGGARSIRATNVEMRNSGAVTVSGEHITVTQSSALVVAGDKVDLSMTGSLAVQANEMTISGDSGAGVLVAGNVKSKGDFRAVLGIIGNVENEGKVEVVFDPKSAFALGAGIAVVLTLLRKIVRR